MADRRSATSDPDDRDRAADERERVLARREAHADEHDDDSAGRGA